MKLSPIGIGLMLLAASSSAWGVRPKTSQMVPLRDVVVVDHEIILLSDLLPANAPLALKSAGDAIPLGRAPQIGSIRTFEPEQITHQLAIAPTLLAVLRIPFRITIRRFQWPIKNTAVRNAISVFLARQKSKFGDLMSSATFQLDSTGALQQDPSLSVTGMDWDDRRGVIQFRLRCANRAVCGSFLAYAVSPLSITADGWAKFGSQLFPNDRAMAPSVSVAGPALAEKGKPAILILEGTGLRISIPVVCLGRGALNQQIRVLDAKSHRVFNAAVVGVGLLRASL